MDLDLIGKDAAPVAEEPGDAKVKGEEGSPSVLGSRRASGSASEGQLLTRWASEVSPRGDCMRRARGQYLRRARE